MNNIVLKALEVAQEHHKDQVDKNGEPYIFHLLRVWDNIYKDYPKDYELQAIALLHDVLEDSHEDAYTYDDLCKFFSSRIMQALIDLNIFAYTSRKEYIEGISKNRNAIKVKLADLFDNMNIARYNSPTEKDITRCRKYLDEYIYLQGFLNK